jgi:hypothetical protein
VNLVKGHIDAINSLEQQQQQQQQQQDDLIQSMSRKRYDSLLNIVTNWGPDNPEIPATFKESLQHFNYSNPIERDIAYKFRDAEIPFKVYEYGALPPAAPTVIEPFFAPIHVTFDLLIKLIDNPTVVLISVTIKDAIFKHPF